MASERARDRQLQCEPDTARATLHRSSPEESTSYEAGLKTSFLEERAAFNLSVFHQEFDNYVYRDSNVYFVNYRRLTPTIVAPEVGTFAFVAGVPATVDGAEAEVSFQIKPLWRVTGNGATRTARSRMARSPVPI